MVDVQPDGNGQLTTSPDDTWMSLNTNRPHTASAAAPTGVLNEKYCETLVKVEVPSVALGACTHSRMLVLSTIEATERRPSLTGKRLGVPLVAPATSFIH